MDFKKIKIGNTVFKITSLLKWRDALHDSGFGDPKLTLAHYDKRGGNIIKNGRSIKNGHYWDFTERKPIPWDSN